MCDPSVCESLQPAIDHFLLDLQNANRSPHTLRAYRSDLLALARCCPVVLSQLDASHLRTFFAQHAHLKPATRARKQSAVASFLQWAYRQDRIPTNPMLRIDRVQVDHTLSRPPDREQIASVLLVIPRSNLRDRLLFGLIFETRLRISEALALYIEDLDLAQDDEHITVLGKGSRKRTILLDDPQLVILLKRYLRQNNYQHGPSSGLTKTIRAGRSDTSPFRNYGRNTVNKPGCTAPCISYDMLMPPNWSTRGSVFRPSVSAWDTSISRRPCVTLSNLTTGLMLRFAPGGATKRGVVDDSHPLDRFSVPLLSYSVDLAPRGVRQHRDQVASG